MDILERLRVIRDRPPSLDRGAVEISFHAIYRNMKIAPLPIRWFSDPIAAYAYLNHSWAPGDCEHEAYGRALKLAHPLRYVLPDAVRSQLSAWCDLQDIPVRRAAFRAALSPLELEMLDFYEEKDLKQPTRWLQLQFCGRLAQEGAALGLTGHATLQDALVWHPFFDAFEAGLWIYWFRKKEIVAVPRPLMHMQDDRLHGETGPAVCWPNGCSFWFWKGVRVTEQIILRPHTLDVKKILNERNAELRHVTIERFGGIQKLVREAARTLNRSNWGTLYWLVMPGEREAMAMVELTCPSTGRKFMLRVPPHMRTAHEAVAWTFGLRSRSYKPAEQA